MADITYSKPTWVNGSSVKLNETNMQAISDAIDGICHLANRGGAILDADTVSGYGIGVDAPAIGATFAIAIPSGLYTYGGTTTDAPSLNAGNLLAVANHAGYDLYLAWAESNELYRGFRAHGTTGAIDWKKIWDASSDGNGGQPPAPKRVLFTTGTLASGWDNLVLMTAPPSGNTYFYEIAVWSAGSNRADQLAAYMMFAISSDSCLRVISQSDAPQVALRISGLYIQASTSGGVHKFDLGRNYSI